jgi:hypothetical protein
MFKFLCLFVFTFTLLLSGAGKANGNNGGWVGMGGELFKDARNPWFVRNTNEVHYCLQVDPKTISVTRDEINQAFTEALNFWKSEFSRSRQPEKGYFELGTQMFTLVSCEDPRVSYKIIFGSSLLDNDQLDFLKDPAKYVGVSVRTQYDTVHLKATGFSYFSDDLNIKTTQAFLQKAWSYPKILRYALMHELGHVFGLPHMGTGLMSEIFLDQLLKPEYLPYYEKLPFESIVQPDLNLRLCNVVQNAGKQFFSQAQDQNCIVLQNIEFNKYSVQSYKDQNSVEMTELGTITLQTPNLDEITGKPLSFLQLSDQQKVFSAQERQFRDFMIGPLASEISTKGKFIPKKPGPSKSVYFRMTPSSLNILGVTPNGDISPILNYTSMLGLIYLFPPKI